MSCCGPIRPAELEALAVLESALSTVAVADHKAREASYGFMVLQPLNEARRNLEQAIAVVQGRV